MVTYVRIYGLDKGIELAPDIDYEMLGEMAAKTGSRTLFHILDYDPKDKNQWPFNGESAAAFLSRKLETSYPNVKQILKMNMLNITEFNGLPVEKVCSTIFLYLVAVADLRLKE